VNSDRPSGFSIYGYAVIRQLTGAEGRLLKLSSVLIACIHIASNPTECLKPPEGKPHYRLYLPLPFQGGAV
jgi:hypothetical protein